MAGRCKVAFLINGLQIAFEEGTRKVEIGSEEERTVWENPLNVGIAQDQKGPTISFSPTCVFGDNEYIEPITSERLIAIYDLDKKYVTGYKDVLSQLKAQRAGIVVPSSAVSNINNIKKHPAVRGRRDR